MSGLVKFVKKSFKKVVEVGKKVLKSKIFKVVAIAAAVIFTGGAAMGAIGAMGSGAGFMGTMAAGFQGGMSALGAVGGAIANGVRAIIPGGATGGAGGAVATGINGTAQGASMSFINGSAVAPTAGKMATFFGDPLVKAAAVSTAGNMISGYAQGRAQQEQMDQIEENRLSRDQYGYDGYGRSTGDLVNPTSRLQNIVSNQAPRVGLDTPPAPSVPAPTLNNDMRNRLIASLDGLKLQPALPAPGA